MKTRLSAVDYEDLPRLREFTRANRKLSDVLGAVGTALPPGRMAKLSGVAPVFDQAPNDLRAFILLALGVRTFHLDQSREETE